MTLRYDEAAVVATLARLTARSRALFAAACAERLQPLYQRCHDIAGVGDPAQLRVALGVAWRAAPAAGTATTDELQLTRWQQLAEDLVPDEDDDGWVHHSGYAQSAAAAVAYALRACRDGDPQTAAWAARQVFDAAAYAAHRQHPALDWNAPGAQDVLEQSAVVREALFGLQADLRLLRGEGDDAAPRLREQASEGGRRLAASC